MERRLATALLCGAALWACTATQAHKPAIPASQLLGQQRSALERQLPAGSPQGAWHSYQDGSLRVRYQQGRATELMAYVPEGMTCRQAARWVGFPQATAPRLEPHRCTWPAADPRHHLGRGFSGELDRKKRLFHAYYHP